jgi:histidyl-tRNA synthetase
MDFTGRKLNKVMQAANQIGASYVAIIGEHELQSQELTLKHMATGTHCSLAFNDLIPHLLQEHRNSV